MHYPLTIRRRKNLIVVGPEFFAGIGEINLGAGLLEIGVSSDGSAHLYWIIDAEGKLFRLTSVGVAARTWAQRLGLKRLRERYQISEPETLTVSAALRLLSGLEDENSDFSNVSNFNELLDGLNREQQLGRDHMKGFLGDQRVAESET